MAMRPRRTAEMGENTQVKAPRVSRIALPIGRTSDRQRSLQRSSSMDRLQSCTSATKRSIVYATPMRTPLKSMNKFEIPATAEKEKVNMDKKWLQEQVAKITEYLTVMESQLTPDFFTRGGLKSMTIKQFLAIVSHFLKIIAGNRLKIGANYVETLPKALSQLGYPYPLNKSWLKTPTAPHAFNNVVTLFSWFLDFTFQPTDPSYFESYLSPCNDFPDNEFTQQFMRNAEDGFILWNNTKENEFKALKMRLMDEIIFKKTNMNGLDAIQEKIQVLNEEWYHLQQNKIEVKSESEFLELDKQIKINEKHVQVLEETHRNNERKLKQLEEMYEVKTQEVIAVQQQLAQLKDTIGAQEMSADERNAMIEKVNYLRQCLESKKKSICKLQDMGVTNQMLLARLIQKKVDVMREFNNYLFQIISEPELGFWLDAKKFCLDQNSEENLESQIERVSLLLENIKTKNQEKFQKYSNQISELSTQVKVANFNETYLKETLAEMQEKYAELKSTLEEINITILKINASGTKELDEIELALKNCQEEIDELTIRKSSKEAEIRKLSDENEAMLVKFEKDTEELATAKEKELDKVGAAIESFKGTMEKINLELAFLDDFICE